MESAITSKGQTTIPKAIRDHLQLKPGDRVRFFIDPNGGVAMLPVIPVTRLRGMLHDPVRPVLTLEDMEIGIVEGATRGERRARPRK